MMASASDVATEERTLVITRMFDAPREMVFKMWTDPNHLIHWMGPIEYPAMKVDNDFHIGGKWRIGLRAADGSEDLWQSGVYREIDEPKKLAFSFMWEGMKGGKQPRETFVSIELEDIGGKTRMTFRQFLFDTVSNRDGHNYGWNSSFDRFNQYLTTL
ncbi:MAG TPA: SRPBCC domain-containing protein [Rhizomicrobium sp.]|nr:SRPBCC domain-containing protein [Rhizomicrobium sp.]